MEFIIGPQKLAHNFNFTIPTHFPNGKPVLCVGIFLSGGLDSTILLSCILHELISTNRLNIEIKCFTIMKPDAVTFYANRCLNLVNEHFNLDNKIKIEHINNIPNAQAAYNFGRIDNDVHEKLVVSNPDVLFYMGINRMVTEDVRQFKHKLKIRYIESWLDNMIFPFLNLSKPQMVDLYKKLNIEFMIKYTHSCVMSIDSKCNNCYSCEERQWAMDELNINDNEFISNSLLKDSEYLQTMIFTK